MSLALSFSLSKYSKSEAKQTGLTVSFEDDQNREETSFDRSSIFISNPTENTIVVQSEVDNDDAEDQQPADGEKADDSSNQKVNPMEIKLNKPQQLAKTLMKRRLQCEVEHQTIRRC